MGEAQSRRTSEGVTATIQAGDDVFQYDDDGDSRGRGEKGSDSGSSL